MTRWVLASGNAGKLREMRALLAECRVEVPAGLPPALACVVGYFAYETLGLVEAIPRPAAPGERGGGAERQEFPAAATHGGQAPSLAARGAGVTTLYSLGAPRRGGGAG